jgi:hypothetical protein
MNCVVKEEDSAAAASTSFHHQFEESSSQKKKKKKNGENNKDDGGGGGNSHETAVNDNFYDDWKVGNWGWERNYDKFPLKHRDNIDGINKRRRNEEVQQIKTEPSCDDDDEDDGDKKPIAAVAIAVTDQPQSVARRLCKSESESSLSSMETRVPILLSCTSIKTDEFSSVKTSDNKPSSIITNNKSNNNIKIKEEQKDDEDIDEGINKDKPKSKNTAISDRTHRKNNSKIKINTDNDSYYDDWEVGNWGWIYDNHKTNTNNNNYDRKDKENIKGDGPTNRKRTHDQSDEEESYDDGDERNIDDDDYNEDTDDDDYEDENDEDKFLPEDTTDFCSKQNKVSRSPAVEGKRRYIDGLKWMRMFQKLVAYKKVHKNTMVPSQYDEDPPLGLWVSHQRRRYKNDKLLPNRITHLNTIGFDWDGVQLIRKENNLQWMKMFQKLVAYMKVHKNTIVPIRYDEDPPLVMWVRYQRRQYKNDKLLPNRITHLNSIDFEWDGVQLVRKENNLQWMKMFQKLVVYKKVHKNTMVPYQYDEDPKLGSWVSTQRQRFKKNKLPKERFDKLDSIGFVWRVLR